MPDRKMSAEFWRNRRLSCSRSDAVQSFIGANQQTIAGNRGRSEADVVRRQFVGPEQFEIVTFLHDAADAIFIQTEDFAVIAPR